MKKEIDRPRPKGKAEEPIQIELSRAQVDHVLHAAGGTGTISLVLSGLEQLHETLASGVEELDDIKLSRSLIQGLLVLTAFPNDGTSLANVELARIAGMTPSTAHRYVSTLLAVGLLERDPTTRRYRLVQ